MSGPKQVDVNVILNSETPGDFTIEPSPLGSLPKGPNGLVFQNDGHDGFEIHFHLQDKTGLNYRFPPTSKKHAAVWSELGAGKCPTSEVWKVFHAHYVKDERMTLVVKNPNQHPDELGLFSYVLRVTKTDGAPYLPLDPGGDNQNGPVRYFAMKHLLAFVGGVIAGCLGLLGGQALIQG